jgi:hypothetical protein
MALHVDVVQPCRPQKSRGCLWRVRSELAQQIVQAVTTAVHILAYLMPATTQHTSTAAAASAANENTTASDGLRRRQQSSPIGQQVQTCAQFAQVQMRYHCPRVIAARYNGGLHQLHHTYVFHTVLHLRCTCGRCLAAALPAVHSEDSTQPDVQQQSMSTAAGVSCLIHGIDCCCSAVTKCVCIDPHSETIGATHQDSYCILACDSYLLNDCDARPWCLMQPPAGCRKPAAVAHRPSGPTGRACAGPAMLCAAAFVRTPPVSTVP